MDDDFSTFWRKHLFLPAQFTFWDPPVQVNMKIDLVIQPDAFPMFEEVAENTGIDFKIKSDNFQRW